MINSIARALNYRPVTTIGVISGFHTFIYGLGWSAGVDDFTRTTLFMQTAEVVSTFLIGLFMVFVGLVTMFGYFRQNDWLVSNGSKIQSLIWLFFSLIYFFGESYILAFGVAFVWVAINFSTGYAYMNRDIWWSGAGTSLDKRV